SELAARQAPRRPRGRRVRATAQRHPRRLVERASLQELGRVQPLPSLLLAGGAGGLFVRVLPRLDAGGDHLVHSRQILVRAALFVAAYAAAFVRWTPIGLGTGVWRRGGGGGAGCGSAAA